MLPPRTGRQILPHSPTAALLLGAGLLLPLLAGCPTPKPWQGITPAEYARLNTHRLIGIAQMEDDQAGNAEPEFAAIRKAQGGLAFGYVNDAAALLRIHRPPEALEAARKGVELAPRLAWPRVVLAKAIEAAGDREKATPVLEEAVRAEPRNPRIIGALVSHLDGMPGDHSERVYELRRELADLQPENLAAQALWLKSQVDRKELKQASETLERIRQIAGRLPDASREFFTAARKALETGSDQPAVIQFLNTLKTSPLYTPHQNLLFGAPTDPADLVMREWDVPPPPLPEPAAGPVEVTWKDVTEEAGLSSVAVQGLAPVACGDWDLWEGVGKGTPATPGRFLDHPDLVAGPSPASVMLNQGQAFAPPREAGAGPASPLLMDFNNDFALDLYVAGPSGDRIWTNPRKVEQREQEYVLTPGGQPKPPVALPGKGPGGPLAVDLDMDGDLDIVRPSGAPSQPAVRYLRNNGNMTFTDLTASSGLSLPSGGARQAVFGDFDEDGTPDLFVVRAAGPSQLFLNRRQDLFRNATKEWGVKPDAGALSATVADFDRDGRWDIVAAGRAPHGAVLYHNAGRKFETDPAALRALGSFSAEWVQAFDYDNDGWEDLAFAGKEGVRLLRNDRGRFVDGGSVLKDAATFVRVVDYDQDGDLDLLVVTAGGRLRLLRNEGGNKRPWMRVELQGLTHQDQQSNNSYAVGAVIEPRTAWDQRRVLVTEPVTHIGLGAAERVVTLRVTWTHGVPQNRIAPELNATVHHVQRPTGSCPFLFTWDGATWRVAGDFNWRSPLGMLFARGAPIPHDQTGDWIRIDGEQMRPVGPYYQLVATEELREVSYFDLMRLLAVDHPADTEVFVDERFRMGPPAPFRIYTARERRLPLSARNEAGEDLLPALKARDNVYTPVPPGPYRGVRHPHDLILDLGTVPDPGNVRLFLNGWIYPAGTSTNVAAAQNPDIRVIPPTLYVGDGHGGWTEADRNVGLPCGKRKTMVLDLSNRFIGNDFRVKLTTTMEIRWDRAFFTSGEKEALFRKTELPLAQATLEERGYSTPYKEVPDGPDLYDYNRPLSQSQAPGWPPIRGAYTRLGECSPLLRKVDDQYAIVAPGDALSMLFDARHLPSLPAGWKRDFVFISDGWTKDSDKNTVTGETVGPLPFHGMKRYPYGPEEGFPGSAASLRWMKEWNTRVKGEGR